MKNVNLFEHGRPLPFQRSLLYKLTFSAFEKERVVDLLSTPHAIILRRISGMTAEVNLKEIIDVDIHRGLFWDSVEINCAGASLTLRGLSKKNVQKTASSISQLQNAYCENLFKENWNRLGALCSDLNGLLDPRRYLSRYQLSLMEREAQSVSALFPEALPKSLPPSRGARRLMITRHFLANAEAIRSRSNALFEEHELVRSKDFFDCVEARPLTEEQRRAVLKDEDCNLVVAAAGSGKTSVITAKAEWLVHKGYRQPGEVVLLAFGTDAREEIEDRVKLRPCLEGVSVSTFHSWGMKIIGDVDKRRPALSPVAQDDKALRELIKGFLEDLLSEPPYFDILCNWFQNFFAPYRSTMEFRSLGEYWDYVRNNEIRSLKGELVKSFEECALANFLFVNGVPYEYERPYEYDTATATRRQYKPDFYLSKHGIYIEHFALSSSGDTPPFIDKEKYLAAIDWKRRLHAERGTCLVETFSYERESGLGSLTDKFREKLEALGVAMSPIPVEAIFVALEKQGRADRFTQLMATFLKHFKEAGLNIEDLVARAARQKDSGRAAAFVTIFQEIYARYQARLSNAAEIDFADMIGKATQYVEERRFISPFHHILVDEFQDISPGRARLLSALLNQNPETRLFAVGDDWQSIYRFGGADISIFRDFSTHFGVTARTDLTTTFRCDDRIASVATQFILKNRSQLQKSVRAASRSATPCVIACFPTSKDHDLLYEALKKIQAEVAQASRKAKVLLLGRYTFSEPRSLQALKRHFEKLNLSFQTVHASKGQEADYVVVLGLHSGRHGFPSEITDDPLLDLVLAEGETHPNAEERRIFYVALTRARRKIFLLADGAPSKFVDELVSQKYDVAVEGRTPDDKTACPICVRGRLGLKKGRSNAFHACSNWPYCNHTEAACPSCGRGLVRKIESKFTCSDCDHEPDSCPECSEGYLLLKRGKHGQFYGCSRWPSCSYKRRA